MTRPIQFDSVADLYDVYVNADLDLAFFLEEARRSGGRVLELTSGTGRVSLPLLRAGVNLTCVDYSREMLARLREKIRAESLRCDVIGMDITELTLEGDFDLIFIPFHSFQEIVDEEGQLRALIRVHQHLADTGLFICTLQNPVERLKSIDGNLKDLGRYRMDSNRSLEVKSKLAYEPATRLVHGFQTYRISDEKNQLIEERRLGINFRLFSRAEFGQLASSAGFRTVSIHGDYNRSAFDEETSPFMIWNLRKNGGG
jgi:SAM-dependent methyltransferase